MPFRLGTLVNSAKAFAIGNTGSKAGITHLFPAVDRAVDGDDCDRDCASCTVRYPAKFSIEESDKLYGFVKGWSTHVLVATGKSDWVRDVADEKGSLMEAIDKAGKPANGRLMLSASNMPTPSLSSDYSEPTSVLLLPAFTLIDGLTPADVPRLMREHVETAPTTQSSLESAAMPPSPSAPTPDTPPLLARPCPHRALVLLCSQKTRDARCGQSAPLLRKELQRHLAPLGLYRDLDDDRPGGVGIYFISHVGGHKYSANVMVYRRPDAFGLDAVERARVPAVEAVVRRPSDEGAAGDADEEAGTASDPGAAQCIWLARVRPEHVEHLVKFTILQGKVVRPEHHLRGGFDRAKGLMSW